MEIDKSKILKRFPLKEKWKKDGWVPFPKKLLFDPNISKSALVVFMVLHAHLFRGTNYVYPSISTIAKESKQSIRTVHYAIRELKKSGYLKVESGKETGKSNKYFLVNLAL